MSIRLWDLQSLFLTCHSACHLPQFFMVSIYFCCNKFHPLLFVFSWTAHFFYQDPWQLRTLVSFFISLSIFDVQKPTSFSQSKCHMLKLLPRTVSPSCCTSEMTKNSHFQTVCMIDLNLYIQLRFLEILQDFRSLISRYLLKSFLNCAEFQMQLWKIFGPIVQCCTKVS